MEFKQKLMYNTWHIVPISKSLVIISSQQNIQRDEWLFFFLYNTVTISQRLLRLLQAIQRNSFILLSNQVKHFNRERMQLEVNLELWAEKWRCWSECSQIGIEWFEKRNLNQYNLRKTVDARSQKASFDCLFFKVRFEIIYNLEFTLKL